MERFAPGRLGEMDRCLGRSVQYLRRVSPAHLRLEEAFAAMRFLGFKPAEYLSRMAGFDDRPPRGPLGFFRRHRLMPTHRIRVSRLSDFCAWAYGVDVDGAAEGPELPVGSAAWAGSLDARSRRRHVLSFADFLLPFLAEHAPPAIRPRAARALVETLLLLVEHLPRDRPHVRAASQLLDVAFHLEDLLDEPALRHRLFAAGARISRDLGYGHDALWCLGEALDLAARLQDFGALEDYREALVAMEPDHFLAPRTESFPSPSLEVLAAGRRDRDHALGILDSSRDTSSLTAVELDRRLGAKEAFAAARHHGAGMTLARWGTLVHALGQSPDAVMRRAAILDPAPTSMGGFLQGLKLPGKAAPGFPFQRPLLAWSRKVEIRRDAEAVDVPSRFEQAHLDPHFFSALSWLEELGGHLPRALRPADAERLCRLLVQTGYRLGQNNRLDEAVDFFDASLNLQDRMEVSPTLAFTYRMGSYLAIWLGDLQVASSFLKRAVALDLALGHAHDCCLTQYARGMFTFLQGRHEESLSLFHACLKSVQEGCSTLPEWFAHAAVATQSLCLGDLDGAEGAVQAVDRKLPENVTSLELADFLMTKAELVSRKDGSDEALQILDRAGRGLDPDLHARDLVLIGLRRCDHFLRQGRLEACRTEARSLLRFERALARNPIGRGAVLALAKRTLVGTLAAEDVESTRKRVAHPFLFEEQNPRAGRRNQPTGIGTPPSS